MVEPEDLRASRISVSSWTSSEILGAASFSAFSFALRSAASLFIGTTMHR